jgi:hypothetical protein
MWYTMPSGRAAVRVAAAEEVQRRLAAIRCAATLIVRRCGPRERELGNAILDQLRRIERAVTVSREE